MEDNKDFINEIRTYWSENEDELKKNYPGISITRLNQEVQAYIKQGREGVESFFGKVSEGVPLEYISGRSYFFRSEFLVTPDVLIPRSETEILVEKAVALCQKISKRKNNLIKVADIGTGSGAIILSIARELGFHINGIATDIDSSVLEIAKKNYYLLRNEIHEKSEIRFLLGDRLEVIGEKLDLIVSNPPYIKEDRDRSKVHEQVRRFEPWKALFLKDDQYLSWFESFFNQVQDCLFTGGHFLMEGHEDHLEELAKLASQYNLINIEIIKDYNQRNRFLLAEKGSK